VKRLAVLAAILAVLILPTVGQAASHTAATIAQVGTPVGTTFFTDWSSLAAAKADTGTTYIDLNDPAFRNVVYWNSSGVPLITLELSATFAALIDSTRLEIASGNTPSASGTWITEYTFTGSTGGANATLLTAAIPKKRITFSPSLVGALRIRQQNCDATTAGLIDQFITALRRTP